MSFPLPAPEKSREQLTYKTVPEQALKPAVTFWQGPVGHLFFWSDLLHVVYHPRGEDAGEEAEPRRPEEAILLHFRHHEVKIRGHQIRPIFLDCQRYLVDFIRLSPKEAVLQGSGLLITSLVISEVKPRR